MDLSYIINEYAEDRDAYFRAVAPPLIQTSNFAFKKVDGLRRAFEDEYGNWLYSRGQNPTVDVLRKKLAALDEAEDCLVFNSGAAAIYAAVLSHVKAGDHIVSVRQPYTWTRRLFDEILPRFNISTTYVDGRIPGIFEKATAEKTVLYYLESPNSWTYEIQDLKAVAAAALEKQIITICDNSYCTPLNQKPLTLGIDFTVQSATKYISGHSDVVAGVLCGKKAAITRIFNSEYMNIGSGIQPFNAWMLLRGLRTMPVRLQRSAQTTEKVIGYLASHARVEKILYPMMDDFEQISLARSQMSGAGGLFTFIIKVQDIATIEVFCETLNHFLMAVSWGGYESLIVPACASYRREDYDATDPSQRMIRMYVGLEDPEYLISDLEHAFKQISLLP